MENYWILLLGISSLITCITCIFSVYIRERYKSKQIEIFKDLDNDKIEAIGNYEKKSKFRNSKKIKNDDIQH